MFVKGIIDYYISSSNNFLLRYIIKSGDKSFKQSHHDSLNVKMVFDNNLKPASLDSYISNSRVASVQMVSLIVWGAFLIDNHRNHRKLRNIVSWICTSKQLIYVSECVSISIKMFFLNLLVTTRTRITTVTLNHKLPVKLCDKFSLLLCFVVMISCQNK